MSEDVVKYRKTYTQCRMCQNPIPENSPYRHQGYCDCIYSLTRHGGLKDTKELYEKKTEGSKPEVSNPDRSNPDKSEMRPSNEKNQKDSNPTDSISNNSTQHVVKCFRCNYMGHLAKECRTKMCEYCKGRRHTAETCRKNPNNECVRCRKFGHNMENCNSKLCDTCGKIGHLSQDCWNAKECDNCGQKGHPASYCRNYNLTDNCQTKMK